MEKTNTKGRLPANQALNLTDGSVGQLLKETQDKLEGVFPSVLPDSPTYSKEHTLSRRRQRVKDFLAFISRKRKR